MIRKQSFTLVEILVAMSILTLFATVTTIGIVRTTRQYRFNQSCRLIERKITLAKQLATATQGGVTITFKEKLDQHGMPTPSQLTMTLEGEALPSEALQNILRLREEIAGITEMRLITSRKEQLSTFPIKLTFYPQGTNHNLYEELQLVSGTAKEKSSTISLEEECTKEKDLNRESNALYPDELKQL